MLFGTRRCKISVEFFELNNTMRLLWEQHIGWTRLAIISLVDGTADTELVLARLLENPHDFARFLEPLYGTAIANEFDGLLTEHLVIAAELITAAKIGDTEGVRDAEARWFENAKDITVFLGEVNPHLDKDIFLKMFNEHLALTEAAAVYRLSQNYTRQIEMFDLIELQALEMSDNLTNAIAEQFSNRFSCR